ncbi:MAG: MotA/TolQ/ExbB proton channel family protein [Pirellulaceae bacterium]
MQKVVLVIIAAALILAASIFVSAPASAQEKGPGAKVVAPADAKTPAGAEPALQKKPQLGFFQILFSGGLIGIIIMLVLIGLSLTAAYLVFENALTIRKTEIIPPGLSDEVRDLVGAGEYAKAIKVCREKPCFLSFVLLYGLNEADSGWSEVEKATEDALGEQSARLFRKVEYLSVLGNIAPMVGLLGTVTGMLMAFKQVADTEGNAGASELADGIYQALVTTVVGLIIAIPSLGAFAIFRNRVDQFVAEAAYAAQHALAPIKRGFVAAKAPPAPPPPPPPPRAAGVKGAT